MISVLIPREDTETGQLVVLGGTRQVERVVLGRELAYVGLDLVRGGSCGGLRAGGLHDPRFLVGDLGRL